MRQPDIRAACEGCFIELHLRRLPSDRLVFWWRSTGARQRRNCPAHGNSAAVDWPKGGGFGTSTPELLVSVEPARGIGRQAKGQRDRFRQIGERRKINQTDRLGCDVLHRSAFLINF